MCVHLYACVGGPERPEGIRSPEDGVIGGCEPPDMGAENPWELNLCRLEE